MRGAKARIASKYADAGGLQYGSLHRLNKARLDAFWACLRASKTHALFVISLFSSPAKVKSYEVGLIAELSGF